MRSFGCLLAVIIFIFSTVTVFGQSQYIFEIDAPNKPKAANACKTLKVIDLRKDQTNIGYLRKGAFNRKMTLVTEQPLDVALQSAYAGIKGEEPVSNDELVLVLYSLDIQDKLDGDESGTFYFSGDFFRGADDKFKYIASIDSLYEMRASMDVTNLLLKGSKSKLNFLLSYYATQKPTQSKLYSITEASDKRNSDKLNYPVYNNAVFKKGIYYTKEQFLNNTPVDTPLIRKTYTRDGGLKTHYFHYLNEKGKKGERVNESTYFAIYDGEDWWVSNVSYCTIMRYADNEFYAQQFFKQAHAGTSGSAIEMGAMFGLIGGLIGAGVDAGVGMINNGKNAQWGLYRSRFNPVTKDFVPIDRPHVPQ